jgi:HrpA-like RNA helicase
MGLPTLLKHNVIIPHMGESKSDISNITGIDFILQWFHTKINMSSNETITISDRIVILKSATGSGKSTVFPTEFYLRFNNIIKKNVIVTQPRILTAVSIPKTIASEPAYKKENRIDKQGIELYKNIGYQTKEYIRKPIEKGILFCTIGVLLQFLKNMLIKNLFNKYGCIIIDEAHERSTNLDLIFYYLKKIYLENNILECPFLVIASATMNVKKYAKYYNTKTIFEITGTSYPIDTTYLNFDSSDIFSSIISIISDIHKNNLNDDKDKSDIIIFIPSVSYINKLKLKILDLNKLFTNKLYPIGLDSSGYKASGDDYNALFDNIDNLTIDNFKPTRKIIIATNIAETGITIESLKYCIDTGLVNQLEYNPVYNTYSLLIKPVTQSMTLQRKGRVGRKHPGKFYPVYTQDLFKAIQEIQYPELLTEDLTPILLNLIIIKYTNTIEQFISLEGENLFSQLISPYNKYNDIKTQKPINIMDLELLDNPPKISILNGLHKLYNLGLIFSNGYPTKCGLIVNKIKNISLENAIMIISGYINECNILDLITIAAFNTVGRTKLVTSKFKNFNFQFNNKSDTNIDMYNYNRLKLRLLINCEFIDFLLFFKQFQLLLLQNNINVIQDFCLQNHINYSELMNIIIIRDEIIQDLTFNMNLNPMAYNHIDILSLLHLPNSLNEAINNIIQIKKCLYEGFKLNIAVYNPKLNKYIIKNTSFEIQINSYLTKNLPILNSGKKFEVNKPPILLFDSSIIKKNPDINNYQFHVANTISILSGYINIDSNF